MKLASNSPIVSQMSIVSHLTFQIMLKMETNHKSLLNKNITKVCRCCLSERGYMHDIFLTKINKLIESIASVKLEVDDKLPKQVCTTCFHFIAKFHAFKNKIEKSNKILLNHLISKKNEDILIKAINVAEITNSNEFNITEGEHHKNSDSAKENEQPLQKNNFFNEPPPLIPLETSKPNESKTKKHTFDLPKDTPPLVLIKPETKGMKYNCNVCLENFDSIPELKKHKMKQCQKGNLHCNICYKEFSERKKLIGHLKGHMVTKDFACEICGKKYPNPSTFKVHMRTHTGERPFKCQICNKGFVRWAGVLGHMKAHQSVKPYKCETCGKAFKISSNLERHKLLHSGKLPYCCSYCGKTFTQSDNLQLHIRTYHTFERPYLCNECGKGFVSSTRLNRHMWVHSGFKPYRCRLCPKAYSNSHDLKNHERVHLGQNGEGEKPYGCKCCNKRFYHPCRLARHMKTHERPFNCNICNKGFTSTKLMVKHFKNKHNLQFVEEETLQDNVNEIFENYQ